LGCRDNLTGLVGCEALKKFQAKLRGPFLEGSIFPIAVIETLLCLCQGGAKGVDNATLVGSTTDEVTANLTAKFTLHNFLPKPPS
jgi:hypothetical protein